MHPNQLTISGEAVRDLVDVQFPQWRGRPIKEFRAQGTVNALFRIGDRLAARFPLEPGDVETTRRLLQSEAQAAREVLGRTRFRTPEPVAIGEPGEGYPLPWSVQTWLPGTVATEEDPSGSVAFARDLAEFIRGVRALDTRGRTFNGEGRGGDLIPGNVLVSDGRLTAVIDVGGLGPADPALDLVCAWHLLDAGPRQVLRDDLGCDDLEWERGKAWAFEQAIGAAWVLRRNQPRHEPDGSTHTAPHHGGHIFTLSPRPCQRPLLDVLPGAAPPVIRAPTPRIDFTVLVSTASPIAYAIGLSAA